MRHHLRPREHILEVVLISCVQIARRISLDAKTVSALRRQSAVTGDSTVLMDQTNVDVVSRIYYKYLSWPIFSIYVSISMP